MRAAVLIASIIAALSARAAATTCEEAAAACDFYFNGHALDIPVYNYCKTPTEGPGFTNSIKLRDTSKTVQNINTNPTDMYLTASGSFQLLTSLNSQLSNSQFKTFTEPNAKGVTATRIGHETFQGGSTVSAGNKCIKVSFANYVYKKSGQIVNVTNATAGTCIVFETGACPPPAPTRKLEGNLRGSNKL